MTWWKKANMRRLWRKEERVISSLLMMEVVLLNIFYIYIYVLNIPILENLGYYDDGEEHLGLEVDAREGNFKKHYETNIR